MAKPHRICSVEGCGKDHAAHGYCWSHHGRWKRYGDPLASRPRYDPPECSIDGCSKPAKARGWCDAHWQRWQKNGDPLGSKPRAAAWYDGRAEEILRQHYADTPTKDLQARYFPERSVLTVTAAANALGLTKSADARARRYDAQRGRVPWNVGPKITCACEICGASFDVPPSRTKALVRHCSRKCSHEAKRRVTGTEHKLWRRVECQCAWCGDTFYAVPARLRVGQGRFCSRQCVGSYSTSMQDGRRSSIEIMVEDELAARGVQFIPQKQMGKFICDFYLPAHKMVIECDGDYWHSLPGKAVKDMNKDRWLTTHGQQIVRLTETEIRLNPSAAVTRALGSIRDTAA